MVDGDWNALWARRARYRHLGQQNIHLGREVTWPLHPHRLRPHIQCDGRLLGGSPRHWRCQLWHVLLRPYYPKKASRGLYKSSATKASSASLPPSCLHASWNGGAFRFWGAQFQWRLNPLGRSIVPMEIHCLHLLSPPVLNSAPEGSGLSSLAE